MRMMETINCSLNETLPPIPCIVSVVIVVVVKTYSDNFVSACVCVSFARSLTENKKKKKKRKVGGRLGSSLWAQ